MIHRLALRVDNDAIANLNTVSDAIRHPTLRAKVTDSDAMRAALAVAARVIRTDPAALTMAD